ncbi:MAG: acyl-homoserine-lactone synthase [Halioglobus sp.]
MIRFINGTDLWQFPSLAQSMFKDRTEQFRDRLGWPVEVDPNGFERDQYDRMNPLYAVVEGDNGEHLGSMRLMPTEGSTMINDQFLMTLAGSAIRDRSIWECTRFCISPRQPRATSFKVLVAGAAFMQELRVKKLVAIFDARMQRIYQRSGINSTVIGSHEYEYGEVSAGFWEFDDSIYRALLRKSELDPLEVHLAIANLPSVIANLKRRRVFSSFDESSDRRPEPSDKQIESQVFESEG